MTEEKPNKLRRALNKMREAAKKSKGKKIPLPPEMYEILENATTQKKSQKERTK